MPSTKRAKGLAVIVPVGGALDAGDSREFAQRLASIGRVARHSAADELVIAADASTSDGRIAELERSGARVLRTCGARGGRMRRAARGTHAATLLFLHWDTAIDASGLDELRRTASPQRPWGAFRLRFQDSKGRRCMPLIAAAANARARWAGLPYGDQGQWVRRDAYEDAGGHPDWNFLEDLELARRLRRVARPKILSATASTSARRYESRGRLRTVLKNGRILARFARGADPRELERIYRA